MKCRGLIRPEGRILTAPRTGAGPCTGQKARCVPDLPDALLCHFSVV